MSWDWEFVGEVMPRLLHGFELTILATVLASLLSLTLGLGIAVIRISGGRWLSRGVYGVTEFIRRTPILVQLYFIFYVMPEFGLKLSPLAAGVIGLGLHYSTYTAEIYRAGIASIGKGQWEAAAALDLSRRATWRHAILPQAIPKMTPALGNTVIQMFKETALLSAITVQEVLGVAREIGTETYDYTEPLLVAGALYFIVSYASSLGVRALERRIAAARA